MTTSSSSASLAGELQAFCKTALFGPGEVLREAGHHYNEMYWLSDGQVDVELAPTGRRFSLGADAPVGEIGFLRGCPATATVISRTAVSALVIDEPTLARLECTRPAFASELLRHLAEVAEDRVSANLVFTSSAARAGMAASDDRIEVRLCRTEDMHLKAQSLRYSVYCGELGRTSPNADHELRIIRDNLDIFAHTFIAIKDGETIGTLRGNWPVEGSLGILEELYGMTKSPVFPTACGICTKFVIRRQDRGGAAAMKLIAAMVKYALRHGIKECYIDCIPALLHYYRALGFKVSGKKFLHRENGPSFPMMVDVARHGPKLGEQLKPFGYMQLYLAAQAIKWWDRAQTGWPGKQRGQER